MGNKKPSEFNPLNDLRIELDSKIEKKLSNQVFGWFLTLLIATISGIFIVLWAFSNYFLEKQNKDHEIIIKIQDRLEVKKIL